MTTYQSDITQHICGKCSSVCLFLVEPSRTHITKKNNGGSPRPDQSHEEFFQSQTLRILWSGITKDLESPFVWFGHPAELRIMTTDEADGTGTWHLSSSIARRRSPRRSTCLDGSVRPSPSDLPLACNDAQKKRFCQKVLGKLRINSLILAAETML